MNTIDDQTSPEQASAPSGRAARYEARYPPIGVFETASIDGAERRAHLLDCGPAESEAIVLIHGASGNLRDFAFRFIDQLAAHPAGAGRRIIAIDRPGFGYSDRGPGAAYRPDAQARIMRAALARRGVTRVVLVGQSLGAASALAWTLDAPEMVRGVLDVAGATHPWKGTAGFNYDVLSLPVVGRLAAEAAEALVSEEKAMSGLEAIFAPESAPAGYAEYVGVGLALRAATVRANGLDVGKLKPLLRAQSARYGEIRAPIEIVHGDADTIVPPDVHSEPLLRAAPTARLTMLAGVGHMPHHTAPQAIFEALGRVLARSPA